MSETAPPPGAPVRERATILYFTAPRCSFCAAVSPVLDQVAREWGSNVRVEHLDVSRSPERAARFGVRGTPTLIAVHRDVETGRLTGVASAEAIRTLFRAAQSGEPVGRRTPAGERRLRAATGVMLVGLGILAGWQPILLGLGAAMLLWAVTTRPGH